MRTKSSIVDLYSATVWFGLQWTQVVRLAERFRKIARLTPVFLWVCPSFCDLVHIQSDIEPFGFRWTKLWKCTKSQKDDKIAQKKLELRPTFRPSNARIFAKIAPVFCLSFYKNVISVDQSWIRAGHIQGDVFEPFSGSGMAIGGRHRAPNWPKLAEGAIRHL